MLRLVPVTYRQAMAWVAAVHRHHIPPRGYRWAVGVADGPTLHGVAIAGRPVARHLDDGHTVEITRVATDCTPNACSMLYGACWRAARALGFTRAVTYTQHGETGASLRAAGWLPEAQLAARPGWHAPSRPRTQLGTEHIGRTRWGMIAADHTTAALAWPQATADGDDPALFEVAA